ncbi:MAG: hypothetical protein OXI64_06525, partial [Defluviicoccus sp.]|nr:hypothetical protein [Defluviicoccus sp.]
LIGSIPVLFTPIFIFLFQGVGFFVFFCQSREVGAPESSAPLSVAGHTARPVPMSSCPDLFRA